MAMTGSSSSSFVVMKEEELIYKGMNSSEVAPAIAATVAVTDVHTTAPPRPQKRRRNQPGTLSPDAEVIALCPETLLATNRFVCDVCNKGFQREQNLQLHRRGHNLPWQLKTKSTPDLIRKKVYVCPVPGCVHHDPSRALGDLTGIKKHYSRKHGEKKFLCEKCKKSYAVYSDWKAHSKTCGSKEYKCECGTTFSRRDSYYSHRGYCDALAQKTIPHSMIPTSIAATIYANASSAVMDLATAGPIISVEEQGGSDPTFGLGGPAGGSKSSLTSLLSGSIGSAFRPIQPPTIPNPMEHRLTFQKVSHISGYSSSATNLNNFSFNVGPGSMDNVVDATNCNMFSSMMNAADQGLVYTLPPQLSATALLQKASLMGSDSSHGPASFMNSFGSSSTCGLKMNNYYGGGVLGDGIVSGGFQELMLNSIAGGGGSNVYESGGFAGNVENDYGMYKVKSAMELEENHLERQVSIQSCDKLTRDFLGVGNRKRSISCGAVQEQMEASSCTDSEATTSAEPMPFVGQRII